ncbi:MAG: hypothetical protein ACO3L8_02580, partial [Ilumatobacteraceae bacterium]
ATRRPTLGTPATMTPIYISDGSMGSTTATVTSSSGSEIQFRTSFFGSASDFVTRVTVSDGSTSVSESLTGC